MTCDICGVLVTFMTLVVGVLFIYLFFVPLTHVGAGYIIPFGGYILSSYNIDNISD